MNDSRIPRVLLVEDDPRRAELLAKNLGCREGFQVVHRAPVFDGGTLDLDGIDAVLVDLATATHGAQVVEAIAAHGANVPVILLSGNDDLGARDAVRAGAQDCLLRRCVFSGCQASGPLLRRAVRHSVERKQIETGLAHRVDHDPLTGLVNRPCFETVVDRALARARRRAKRVAVLFFDIDGFKPVNDSLGHTAGDTVLQEFAKRLVGSLREADTVARIGGDEFATLLEDVCLERDVVVVVRKIQRALGRPFSLRGQKTALSASIGAAMSSGRRTSAAGLIDLADAAMYRAKRRGAGGYEICHPAREDAPADAIAY